MALLIPMPVRTVARSRRYGHLPVTFLHVVHAMRQDRVAAHPDYAIELKPVPRGIRIGLALG